MANTPNLGLPTMDPSVLQPSIPFNAAMQILDVVAQLTVQGFTNTPPTTALGDAGKAWLVGTAPTGAWAGQAGKVALCTAANLWAFIQPFPGWKADLATSIYRYNGTTWVVQASGGFYVPGFISGLTLAWQGVHTVRLMPGTAHNQGADVNYRQDNYVDLTVPSTASTWFYFYQYGNNQAEVSTTGPYTVPYAGTAMSKGGDTSRRYLGACITNTAGEVVKFVHTNGQILYNEGVARSLSAVSNTTFTTFSLSALVPAGAMTALIALTNSSATVPFRIRPIGYNNAINSRMYGIPGNGYAFGPLPLNSSQQAEYQTDASGNGNLDVIGYYLDR